MGEEAVKVLITGDFCPINRIEKLALSGDYSSVFNDFIEILRGNDLNITDLECPLTFAEAGRAKTGPHQKAHPDCVRILTYADIGLVAMANNHIMDYGSQGVHDTIELCAASGISSVGVGSTETDAARAFTIKIRNKSLAILNFADNEFISSPDGMYTCPPVDPVKIYNELRRVRASHDFVIILLHTGNEFFDLPSPRTKALFRYLIDIGADVVISNHTHAYSGFEVYKTKLIFYGLGNFVYDWPGKINDAWNEGYAVRLFLTDELRYEVIPFRQCSELPGVFRLNDFETKTFNANLERLNSIIADEGKLEAGFQRYCESVFPMYDSFIEPYMGRRIASLRKRGLFPKLVSGRKRLLYLNIIRCESHRDVLVRMLKRFE